MAERTLTSGELNRALLERQMLLTRRRRSIPETLRRMGGLQAQYAPSMYVGLWSRIEGLRRDAVTRALERREVVQATAMRCTIHLLARDQYWPFVEAVRAPRRAFAVRQMAQLAPMEEMDALAARLRDEMRGRAMRRAEVEEVIGKPATRAINLWLDLVRVPPAGTWERRRADVWGLADEWLGPSDASPAAGVALLVRSYLGAFGPSTRDEIATFSGLTPDTVEQALETMTLRRFRAEDGAALFDLPRAPLPPAGVAAPVRMLPTFDAMLLVHARRTGVLPEEYRPVIFTNKRPQSVGTFTVDGRVAGEWRPEGERVVVEPYAPLPAAARRELEDERAALERFVSPPGR